MGKILSGKKIIFTGEKETFILRAIIEKVQNLGLECSFVPFTVDALNASGDDIPLYILYMDEEVNPREDALHFLTDTMEENGSKLILIGEQIDLNNTSKHLSGDLLYKTFSRPVNNDEFMKAIRDYFDKTESGEYRKSILIVDDDPQYLSLVRQWLKDTYRVFMANSGLQAIKYLGKSKVDLILLDHEMPVTSGPQVLEMLRSDPETSSIPVIFLTGKSDKESVMAVVELRPEGYFLKNIKKEDLLEKLKEFFVLHGV